MCDGTNIINRGINIVLMSVLSKGATAVATIVPSVTLPVVPIIAVSQGTSPSDTQSSVLTTATVESAARLAVVYVVQTDDPDAQAFDAEVCRSATVPHYSEAYPENGTAQNATCEAVVLVEDGNTDDAYPRCNDYDCEQFWGNWTECSTFCSNGTRTRSFALPPGDADAEAFDLEVCRSTKMLFYDDDYPVSGGKQGASCDTVAVVEDGSTENAYPRCSNFMCEQFWGNWTECSTFCSNGTRSRSYVVPLHDAEAQAFDAEVCRGAKVDHYNDEYPASGGDQHATCDTVAVAEEGSTANAYPRCHDYDCEHFWSNWTGCSTFCSNGTRTRSFVVPFDDVDAQAFDSEVCRAATVPQYDVPYPISGGVHKATCDTVAAVEVGSADGAYPRCHAFDCDRVQLVLFKRHPFTLFCGTA